MKRTLILIALLTLTGCETTRSLATCDNARRVMALAEAAAERYCPASF